MSQSEGTAGAWRGCAEILVIDEERQLQSSVRRTLRRYGYECHLVRGAKEARRALELSRHDAVLCDAAMSAGAGREFLTYLRTTFPHLPLIMCSAVDDMDLAKAALELGAYGWLLKPLDPGQALITITNALGRAQLEAESAKYEQGLERAVSRRTSQLEAAVAALELSQARLRYAADHDEFTALFNRRRFEEELAREIGRAERYEGSGALLSVDIDNFKAVNDAFGHAGGDEVLSAVACVLMERSRATDVVARLGDDEFGVLLPAIGVEEARAVAEQLGAEIRNGVGAVAGRPLRVTVSIGAAMFASPCPTPDDLLFAADVAMYEAKQRGPGQVVIHTQAHGDAIEAAATPTSERHIRAALASESFVLHMQPIVDVATRRFSQGELLLRVADREGNLIAPGAFLPTASRMGLMHAVDRWVIHRAVHLIRTKPAPVMTIAVNVSPASVAASVDLLAAVEQELDRASLDPDAIVFELPEAVATAKPAAARRLARGLKELGCSLALDDFGAGLGSLQHLRDLDVGYVKMRGELIRSASRSAVDDRIVSAIVDVAHTMGIKTVAGGVADNETMCFVRDRGVDYAQGFHIGQPTPVGAGGNDR